MFNAANTYFHDTELDLTEKHVYAYGGPAKEIDDSEIDSKTLKAIREAIIRYNCTTQTSGLKLLAGRCVTEVKKEVWVTTPHQAIGTIYCVFLFCLADMALIYSGLVRHSLQNRVGSDAFEPHTDKLFTPDICDLLNPLIFYIAILTKVYLTYYTFTYASRSCEEKGPKMHLHERYWKIINIKTIPSSAMTLFTDAIACDPRGQECKNSLFPRMLSFGEFPHPTLNRNQALLVGNMTSLEEKVFLDYLANVSENRRPIDPITMDPIYPGDLWTSKTIAFNRTLFSTNNLLTFLCSKITEKDGEIPHPMWDGVMDGNEKEKFLEHLSALMGLDVETIGECWVRDEALLTSWAEEKLTKADPQWNLEDNSEDRLKMIKDALRNWLPLKRFTLLPTFEFVNLYFR